jgi:hypothetical protein
MNNSIRISFAVALIAGIVSAAALRAEAAQPVTASAFKYSAPKKGFFMLPVGAFTPSTTNAYQNTGYLIFTTGNCFIGPVNLPNGTRIASVEFWYVKQSASSFTVNFIRQRMSTAATATLMSVTPAGTAGALKGRSVAVADPSLQVVDNAHYQYSLFVCMSDATDNFHGARVTYTYTNAGD